MSADLVQFTLTINQAEPQATLTVVLVELGTLVSTTLEQRTVTVQKLRTFSPVER